MGPHAGEPAEVGVTQALPVVVTPEAERHRWDGLPDDQFADGSRPRSPVVGVGTQVDTQRGRAQFPRYTGTVGTAPRKGPTTSVPPLIDTSQVRSGKVRQAQS
ncbi:hypothetical protein GCM10027445_52480 [Amycolatopsis endophytica]